MNLQKWLRNTATIDYDMQSLYLNEIDLVQELARKNEQPGIFHADTSICMKHCKIPSKCT